MLPLSLADWMARLGGSYLLLGALFALPFAFRWVNRLDPVAARGTLGFRLLILPGSVLLWPILLRRVLRGVAAPPIERSTHRDGDP
jgi:hypothetical protein